MAATEAIDSSRFSDALFFIVFRSLMFEEKNMENTVVREQNRILYRYLIKQVALVFLMSVVASNAFATTVKAYWVDKNGQRITPKNAMSEGLTSKKRFKYIAEGRRIVHRRKAMNKNSRVEKNLSWSVILIRVLGTLMIGFAFKSLLFGGSRKGDNAIESSYLGGG